ncbi:hypothetical protein [Kingella negevensis]|uniref:hypothetical protein n=1 Tax=Kingella negevensis TaxID=1522312 RepID=UPI0005C49B78|nr:hypothetical protein [Kingella negevensis]
MAYETSNDTIYTKGSIPDTVLTTVKDSFSDFEALSERYSSQLSSALQNIGNITIDDVPAPTRLNAPFAPVPSISGINLPRYTQQNLAIPALPTAPNLDKLLSDLDIDNDWTLPTMPVAPTMQIPTAPVSSALNLPSRPNIDTQITIEDAPNFSLPEVPTLCELDLPDFKIPEIPDFNGKPPSPDNIAPPDVFVNWQEPQYKSELLPELTAQIREMMAGGTGLPPAIENALFARTKDRDSQESQRAQQEITDQWAARGFTLPQGTLDKQLTAIREQSRLKAAELVRDVMVQAATWEIENLRFAVQQSIALEQIISNLFENSANRLFEAAKFSAESQISAFNARIAFFNAQNSAFEMQASMYKTQLETAHAKLSAYKTYIEAQTAIGDLNRQQVELYRAKLDGLNTSIELYKTKIQTAQVRADLISKQFDMYRTDVQAYAEQVQAEKLKFDAYQSQLSGEKTKSEIFDAQTRAYSATVSAQSEQINAKAKAQQMKLGIAETKIKAYAAQLDAHKAEINANLSELEYQTKAYAAQVDAYKAQNSAAVAEAEMQSHFADMNVRTNIAYAQMQMSEYQAKVQAANQKAQIALEAAKALGQYTAQLAAGALSAQHVSASMSTNYSASDSRSTSESKSTSHNYSY